MTSRYYILLYFIILINPFILIYTFISIYRNLKKRKVLRKMGTSKTAGFLALLFIIAALAFALIYFISFKKIILCLLIYALTIYFVLEKASKALIKLFI